MLHAGVNVLFRRNTFFNGSITVLKAGGQWEVFARLFAMKGPTFERILMRFIALISDYFYELFL